MVSSPTRTQSLRLLDSGASKWGAIVLPDTALFGTDGIRGHAGDLLTAPLALQIGYWAGQVLKASASEIAPVILGQDSRNSSNMLAMALSAGLTAAGCRRVGSGLVSDSSGGFFDESLWRDRGRDDFC